MVVENVGPGRAIWLREPQLGIRVTVQKRPYSFDVIQAETGSTGFFWIPPGETLTFTFDVDGTGEGTVKVFVDVVDRPSTTPFGVAYYDNFIESDETNNEMTVTGPI